MGATDFTSILELSQFLDTDKPTWRGDYNGDMSKIENAVAPLIALAAKLPTLYAPLNNEILTDFTVLPDGDLPTTHDTGQACNTVEANVAWKPSISSGKVVFDSSISAPAATYIANTPLTKKTRLLGCMFQFPTNDSSTSSAIAMLNWAQQIHPETGGTHLTPLANCHFVITPNSYTFGIYYGNNQDILLTHTFNVPLDPTISHVVEVLLDLEQNVAYVKGPDGEIEIVRDYGQKWATNVTYLYSGILIIANGNTYRLTTPGISASSGTGPSGTGSAINDGTCVWQYVGVNTPAYSGSSVMLPAVSRISDSAYCSANPVPGWELYTTSTSQQSGKILKIWASVMTRNGSNEQPRTIDLAEVVKRSMPQAYAQTIVSLSAYANNAAYSVGQFIAVSGVVYKCAVAGISAATGSGPTGNNPAQDGTVTWVYVGGPYGASTNIADNTAVALNALFAVGGYLYKCTTPGNTGTGSRPTASGGVGGTVTDGAVTWTRIAVPGGGITPLTSAPQIVDRMSFIVPSTKRIIARVSEFVSVGATATDVYVALGISGVTTYGAGNTKVLEQAGNTSSKLVVIEQVLDLSAFSIGLKFDLTVHASIGAVGAANIHIDTGSFTQPLTGTPSGGKHSSIYVEKIHTLF